MRVNRGPNVKNGGVGTPRQSDGHDKPHGRGGGKHREHGSKGPPNSTCYAIRTYRGERRKGRTEIACKAPAHKQRAPYYQPRRVEPEPRSQRIRAYCHGAEGQAREPLATPLHIAKLRNDVHENRERDDGDPRESD